MTRFIFLMVMIMLGLTVMTLSFSTSSVDVISSTEFDPTTIVGGIDVTDVKKSETLLQKVVYVHSVVPRADAGYHVFDYHCIDADNCNASQIRAVIYYMSLTAPRKSLAKDSLICAAFVLTRPTRFALPAVREFIIFSRSNPFIVLRNNAPVDMKYPFEGALDSAVLAEIVKTNPKSRDPLTWIMLIFIVILIGFAVTALN